jgi:hypothetical protein
VDRSAFAHGEHFIKRPYRSLSIGRRARQCDLSTAESAFLLLMAGRYFDAGTADDSLRYRWQRYDEALPLYILAPGSPTYPLSDDR